MSKQERYTKEGLYTKTDRMISAVKFQSWHIFWTVVPGFIFSCLEYFVTKYHSVNHGGRCLHALAAR